MASRDLLQAKKEPTRNSSIFKNGTTDSKASKISEPDNPFKRNTPFQGRIRFKPAQPQVPFDPKFLSYPFNADRFVQYAPTSLERDYKWALHTNPDVVSIDLIDPYAYAIPENQSMDPADEALVQKEDLAAPVKKEIRRRSEAAALGVSWLRQTVYITNDTTSEVKETRKQRHKEPAQVEIPAHPDEDRDIVELIDETFDEAELIDLGDAQHPTNPDLKPIKIIPIFPDADLWGNVYAQVLFDSDPLPASAKLSEGEDIDDNAYRGGILCRSFDPSAKSASYILPKSKVGRGGKKRDSREAELFGEDDEDEEDPNEYQWVREYEIKSTAPNQPGEPSTFIRMTDEKAYYTDLNGRITVMKKPVKTGPGHFVPPSKIRIRTVEPTPQVLAEAESRRQVIMPHDN